MSVAKALTLVLGKSKSGWEARDPETIIIMSSHSQEESAHHDPFPG